MRKSVFQQSNIMGQSPNLNDKLMKKENPYGNMMGEGSISNTNMRASKYGTGMM